jgi:DNA polymerase II large subunit
MKTNKKLQPIFYRCNKCGQLFNTNSLGVECPGCRSMSCFTVVRVEKISRKNDIFDPENAFEEFVVIDYALFN